ncbi:hypothetical protein [Parabacteroides sp.]|uniref:hypothetical protein n=1 Tax=Parabacteroides sp. TaxID=1869337 RepID=UPI00257971C5|nr:hypothetical protein [Parabacteroides sp.]
MVRFYINGLVWLALSLAVISCSQDPMQEAEIREGRVYSFTITQQADPNATKDEGIRTLTLVFTGTSDQIVAVENINPTDFEGTTTDPVLRGTVILKVDESATSVYAFANLESENLTNRKAIQSALTVEGIFDKNTIAKIADINSLTVEAPQAIPMSSHSYAIPQTGGTEKNPAEIGPIVLYRMIAKVEVTLKNNTDTEVTLNSLSLGSFQHRDIYLLPYEGLKEVINDTNKESVRPVFPDKTSTSYSLPIVSTSTSIAAGQSLTPAYTHYIHETDLGENNYITVSARIGDKDATTVNTRFSFVRRNDYLKIPLLLDNSRLVITIEESYAPIGGYPFQKTLNGTEISVHEGSVVQLKVEVQNAASESLSQDGMNLSLEHKSGDLLLYSGGTDETGTYIAQVPAQPTTATSTYTLKANLGGNEYTQDLIFKVVELDAAAITKSAPRSAGASLVLKEFYQLSCQTNE